MHTSLIVLGLAGLLGLSALMLPLAQKLRIPYTVLLALVGCGLGILTLWPLEMESHGVWADLIHTLKNFRITSDGVLFIFLPALVFESALSINTHRLLEDLAPILVLAILGLFISTFVIGPGMALVSGMDFLVCLLLGAILSATDPVAVVAIFKELRAPKRLAILVEGESLFNDATAIVLFSLLSSMILENQSVSLISGTFVFLKIFIGGVLIGLLGGWLVCSVFKTLGKYPTVEITLTICLAYLSFVMAEHYFHVSGVMAVVSSALVLGARGRSIISSTTWHTLKEIWEYIGFWANSLIFILVGLAVPKIIFAISSTEIFYLASVVILAFLGRAMVIYGLLPAFNHLKWIEKISFSFKSVMFWGGLRGAVSLALALSILENTAYPSEIRNFIGVLVTGLVLFTLFINATTVGSLIQFFGLNKLSAEDSIIRARAMEITMDKLTGSIETAARGVQIRPEVTQELIARYQTQSKDSRKHRDTQQGVAEEHWVRIGLMDLAYQEREAYLKLFEEHWIDSSMARQLLNRSEDILDAIRLHGVEGYESGWSRQLNFNWRFFIGRKLQELFGFSYLLSLELSYRLELLIFQRKILKDTLNSNLPKLVPFMGDRVVRILSKNIQKRLEGTQFSLELLKLQYPEYTKILEKRYLERMALRLESREFREMFSNSLISREVFQDLEKELESNAARLEKRPALDLGLEPEKLVSQVPFFSGFSKEQIRHICTLLHPHLAIPDESIIKRGEIGDSMYFISSGCVEVKLSPDPVLLGTGDFFGEIALLKEKPRVADVVAQGYCNLLILHRKDFMRFMVDYPDLKATVEQTANERKKYKSPLR